MYVAQVPEVYQVPALIKHPSWLPLVYALRYPDPENVPLPEVGVELEPDFVEVCIVVVCIVVVAGLPDFGRYLMPVEAQLEDCPTGEVGMKVPV